MFNDSLSILLRVFHVASPFLWVPWLFFCHTGASAFHKHILLSIKYARHQSPLKTLPDITECWQNI